MEHEMNGCLGVGVAEFPLAQLSAVLERLNAGDHDSTAKLLPLVYNELRKLAATLLRSERSDHTLQATALVHETYMRISPSDRIWVNREHFIGFAAHTMRQILVDHARTSGAAKRVPAGHKISIDDAVLFCEQRADELVALDDALNRLAQLSKRQSRIVELRFFGGLTVQEAAKVLGVSEKTIKREWSIARAWLYDELRRG